jgi:glycosyltransferase involved in cell wall biosynthesis
MRIQIFTDAWTPQINGVVRTLKTTTQVLQQQGHTVDVVAHDRFMSYPCPTYKEIQLTINPGWRMSRIIEDFSPQAIHIATEGPIGWAARRYCQQNEIPFSTSFHTRFPEYIKSRIGLPRRWIYQVLRRFHKPAVHTMVSTPTMIKNLSDRGFSHLRLWSRGVDTNLFHPQKAPSQKLILKNGRPVLLYVGRVAVEKNLQAFFDLKTEGVKVVVGDGPQLEMFKKRYPAVLFAGAKSGDELAAYYASADVFVFPSLTDTFGLVMLEALASGVPVAAYPVEGPIDVIRDERVGALDLNLETAVQKALKLRRTDCRTYAESFSWAKAAGQFFNNLAPI